jgi:hypothetical protein
MRPLSLVEVRSESSNISLVVLGLCVDGSAANRVTNCNPLKHKVAGHHTTNYKKLEPNFDTKLSVILSILRCND